MKIYRSIPLLGLLFVFVTSCQKDEEFKTLKTSQSNETSASLSNSESKSTYSEFEQAAMAANISSINFENEEYVISFHDDLPTQTVTFNAFEAIDYIAYDVSIEGITSTIEIDVANELITVGETGEFTFEAYDEQTIASNKPAINNVMPVIVSHHGMHEGESISFPNNGSDDIFPPAETSRRRFWGTANQRVKLLSDDGCWKKYSTRDCAIRFWINWGCREGAHESVFYCL